MKNITIKCEDEFYQELESLFTDLGLDVKTAINIFLHQCLHSKGIPFEIRVTRQDGELYETMMENPIINDLPF